MRKLLATAMAGGLLTAGAYLVPAHAAGSCGDTGPTAAPTLVTNPADGGTVYGGGDTSGGTIGIEGPHGYIEGSGSTSGGDVQGYNPDSGLNGRVNVPPSGASDVCIAPN